MDLGDRSTSREKEATNFRAGLALSTAPAVHFLLCFRCPIYSSLAPHPEPATHTAKGLSGQ